MEIYTLSSNPKPLLYIKSWKQVKGIIKTGSVVQVWSVNHFCDTLSLTKHSVGSKFHRGSTPCIHHLHLLVSQITRRCLRLLSVAPITCPFCCNTLRREAIVSTVTSSPRRTAGMPAFPRRKL